MYVQPSHNCNYNPTMTISGGLSGFLIGPLVHQKGRGSYLEPPSKTCRACLTFLTMGAHAVG